MSLRGLRTLPLRLKTSSENSIATAHFLETMDEVKNVIHPALKQHPDHEIWKKDFKGASGIFAIEFKDNIFHSIADFSKCKFSDKVDFNHSDFKNFVWFHQAVLPDTLILDFVKTDEIIDLTKFINKTSEALSKQYCYISLHQFPLNKVKFNYQDFRLYFPEELSLSFEEKCKTYQDLILHFKEQKEKENIIILEKDFENFKKSHSFK